MKGILYGIGTGPGDSSLITCKALETIKACDVIALPSFCKENCTAYKIVKGVFPEIDSKEFICLDFPMTKDAEVLSKAHNFATEKICAILNEGKNLAFVTIGDVTVYSTFVYVKKLVEENGFQTILINGVSSFCAAAAKLGISLSEQNEEIHIIPGSYELENSFNLDGTLIFMKSGKKLAELKAFLLRKQENYDYDFFAVSNCTMENETVYKTVSELSEDSSYFTTVIVKNIEKKNAEKNADKNYKFFQNVKCENFPCHKIESVENFNCLFCYCPLYFLGEKCGGNFRITEKGIKSCINCNFPHKKENYDQIIARLKQLQNI